MLKVPIWPDDYLPSREAIVQDLKRMGSSDWMTQFPCGLTICSIATQGL